MRRPPPRLPGAALITPSAGFGGLSDIPRAPALSGTATDTENFQGARRSQDNARLPCIARPATDSGAGPAFTDHSTHHGRKQFRETHAPASALHRTAARSRHPMLDSMPLTWYERWSFNSVPSLFWQILGLAVFAGCMEYLLGCPGQNAAAHLDWAIWVAMFASPFALIATIKLLFVMPYNRQEREIRMASWLAAGCYRERFPPPGEDLSKLSRVSEKHIRELIHQRLEHRREQMRAEQERNASSETTFVAWFNFPRF